MGLSSASRQDSATASAVLADLPGRDSVPDRHHPQRRRPGSVAHVPSAAELNPSSTVQSVVESEEGLSVRPIERDQRQERQRQGEAGKSASARLVKSIRPLGPASASTSLSSLTTTHDSRSSERNPTYVHHAAGSDTSAPPAREHTPLSHTNSGRDIAEDGVTEAVPSADATSATLEETQMPQNTGDGGRMLSIPELESAGGDVEEAVTAAAAAVAAVDGSDRESVAYLADARGMGESPAAAREEPDEPAASEGVVIRVVISGPHASFLHMRVFPSTTAGQVCRKIGEKLLQSKAEQSDHYLIAVYPRASFTSGAGTGGDVGEDGDSSSDDEGMSDVSSREKRSMSLSLHGGRKWVAAEDRRRRRSSDGNASVRHVLHTFRPEERLGEHRLGLPDPSLVASSSATASDDLNDAAPGEQNVESGYDSDRRVVEHTQWASKDSSRSSQDQTGSKFSHTDDNRADSDQQERERVSLRGRATSAGAGDAARVRGVVGSDGRRGLQRPSSIMWKSRWIYRDRRASAPEADELQVEVSGSDTSEDEARAGWVDLSKLGQGHYCGYLLKKSSRDANLWRRRWCILESDKLWLLRSKSEQGGRRRRARSHSYPLSLVPCTAREVSRGKVPSHCFELNMGTRTHVFRAESRAKQVVWVSTLQRQARQAGEDSYMSLAEHMVCDEEFARCRRLNSTLLTALGTRSCDALERASYGGGFGSEHQFGTGAGSTNSGGGGFDEVGPYRSVYTTSGPFRPAPATHTPDLTTPVSPLAGGQGGVGATKGVEEEGVVSLTAVQVKRGLRFCMKVHRFREMCRHGSCVAVWKRWAFAADALEELCPGATDRNRWALTSQATAIAREGSSRGDSGSSRRSAPPQPSVVLGSNSSSDTGASSLGANFLSDAATVDTTVDAAVDVTVDSSIVSTGIGNPAREIDDLSTSSSNPCDTESTTGRVAASLGSEDDPASPTPTISNATPTSPRVSAEAPCAPAAIPVADPPARPWENSDEALVPKTAALPIAAPVVPQQASRNDVSQAPTLPQPLLPTAPEDVADVGQAIQDYRASVTSARSRGLAGRGSSSGGYINGRSVSSLGSTGGSTLDRDFAGGGGAIGGGGDAEQGREGDLWPSSVLTSQRSDTPPAAPPDTLLDVLLDQVVRWLGSA